MSEDQELALGRQANAEILQRYQRYDNPALQAYVDKVGQRLARRSHRGNLIYRFTVVDSQEVNAFALPGGYIYVTRGLLAYLGSEAELAAVLGHEIGHVTARHSVRQYTAQQAAGLGFTLGAILLPELRGAGVRDIYSVLGSALIRGYGRDMELEADSLGAGYLARSDYEPTAVVDVIGVLKSQESFELARARRENREPKVYHGLFATHPDNDTRLQEVVGKARKLTAAGTPRDPGPGRERYLHAIDGMTYGPSAREGVLRGNRFYHRDLQIAIQFPVAWRIENLPDRLVATPPQNDARLHVMLEDLNRRMPARAFMVERLGLKDLRAGAPIEAGPLPGYTALAWSNSQYGRRLTRFTVIYHRDRAYVFAAARKDERERHRYRTEFLDTALSLRPLTEAERGLAEVRRLRIRSAPAGQSFSDLAASSPLGQYPEEQLRLLNGRYPSGDPSPGELIKIVE